MDKQILEWRVGVRQCLPIVAVMLAWVQPAHAYHPLITDDTGTQGMGGNQVEVGYDHARSEAAEVTSSERSIPLAFTRGLSDNLDVFAGVARQTIPGDGWGNVGVGLKWRFFEDEAAKFSLALRPEILFPVSRAKEAAGIGNGKTSYGLNFILTQETRFGELHFNLAADRSNYADTSAFPDRRNLYRVSIAPVWHVAERWKAALDLGVQTNPDRAKKPRMGYVEPGLVYSPSEDLDLSFGLVRDVMDGSASTTSATFGLTWRFR